ncbi:alpha/beta-hydrolase [Bimuria novae-zelandiae CBS 107.79]|uniref:Alpha/beta-hydrolase n=1 Tax=Bimuria novae-zelandiae CBS 107.79 TaxID=1447943 RepID=A0A6A5VC02_9PLEO|nr:alpha/beta-hydrolase [Bimuria novae-zelandiae CBS 107.79]
MQSSVDSTPVVETVQIATPSGSLELLTCTPFTPANQQPILCIHGAHCAAACYKALLPLFARAGYASYAVSLRGHGGSWQPSTFAFHALTGINSYVTDAMAALDFISAEHPDTQPIFVGHSMGGAVLQRFLGGWNTLGASKIQPAGLVLLAAAPLSGGGIDVARRWQAAEAALAREQPPPVPAAPQAWVPWLRSLFTFQANTGLDTPAQVRNKFFSPEAPESAVNGWIRDSKGRVESIRIAIEHMWPFANADDVVAAIHSDARSLGRKILCISGGKDVLISKDLTQETFDAYRLASQGEEEIMRVSLADSAHHIMLDVAHERCAELIISWIEGRNIESN